jgi:GNAT superfamily N-acetyltransferase
VSCTTRKASPGDLDALFGLVQKFAMSFPVSLQTFESSARQLVEDDAAWFRVAECDGAVVGYCLGFDHLAFYANGRIAWVEEIMVEAEWRRKGIGALLMAGFEQWTRSRGSKLVALATRRAAGFYAALGYEESATYFRKLL